MELLDDPLHPTAVEEGKGEEGVEGSGEWTMRSIVNNGVALKVVHAICECPAGLGGGCSHVTMVLFLSRLLQMSDSELATFNPQTCTGRACAWITQHAKGGRSTDKCDFYGKPLTAGTSVVRSSVAILGEGATDATTPHWPKMSVLLGQGELPPWIECTDSTPTPR